MACQQSPRLEITDQWGWRAGSGPVIDELYDRTSSYDPDGESKLSPAERELARTKKRLALAMRLLNECWCEERRNGDTRNLDALFEEIL